MAEKQAWGELPPFKQAALPRFPGMLAALGPGVVFLALAQGSAELIWWPYIIAKYGLKAPLASDAAEGGLSDALGIWAEKQNYGRSYMGMVRTTYLIGADGKIARVWNKVKVKGHAEEVLAAAKALG